MARLAPRNLHTLIAGRTGSGKTTLARALLRYTCRAIVLDREWEYEIDGARVAYSMRDIADALSDPAFRWGEFVLVCRPERDGDYLRTLQLAEHMQRAEPHGPLVIVMEEASRYGTTHGIDETVRQLYNAGRHRRISVLTIIQKDTDIHPITRHNSRLIVSMAQTKLSGDMQSYFDPAAVARIVSLETEYTPEPKQGRHFLVYPAVDLYTAWADSHGYVHERIGTDGADNGIIHVQG